MQILNLKESIVAFLSFHLFLFFILYHHHNGTMWHSMQLRVKGIGALWKIWLSENFMTRSLHRVYINFKFIRHWRALSLTIKLLDKFNSKQKCAVRNFVDKILYLMLSENDSSHTLKAKCKNFFSSRNAKFLSPEVT